MGKRRALLRLTVVCCQDLGYVVVNYAGDHQDRHEVRLVAHHPLHEAHHPDLLHRRVCPCPERLMNAAGGGGGGGGSACLTQRQRPLTCFLPDAARALLAWHAADCPMRHGIE